MAPDIVDVEIPVLPEILCYPPTRTFTVADNSAPGGVRTRVSGVFAVAPTPVVAASAEKAGAPAVAVVPPAPVAAPAPPVAVKAPTLAATS